MKKSTLELLGASFSVICTVWGIGMLSIPNSFASGGWPSILYLLVLCGFNIYCSVILSRTLIDVEVASTYADLGGCVLGKLGRILVAAFHNSTMFMVLIILVIVAGSNLSTLFKPYWPEGSDQIWMIISVVCIWPFCLIRSMREVAAVAMIGFVTALITYVISVWELAAAPSIEFVSSEISWDSVSAGIGNYATSFGTALIIPAIHRDLSDTSKMPVILFFSLSIVSISYLVLGVLAYQKLGCRISGSILDVVEHSDFVSVANLSITIHVVIAAVVVGNPLFYQIELLLLRKPYSNRAEEHGTDVFALETEVSSSKTKQSAQNSTLYVGNATPDMVAQRGSQDFRASRPSLLMRSLVGDDIDKQPHGQDILWKSFLIRTMVMCVVLFAAQALRGCFSDMMNLIGNLTVNWVSLIIPCILYLAHFRQKLGLGEKMLCVIIITVSGAIGFVGAISSISTIIEKAGNYRLFSSDTAVEMDCDLSTGTGCPFPFCPEEFIMG